MFDTIEKALAFIKDSWNLLTNSRTVLESRLLEIDRLTETAKKAKDQTNIGRLIVLKTQTLETLKQSQDLWNKLNPFRDYFTNTPQLGILPIALIAGAVGLAGGLYVYLQKVKNEGEALELVKRGVITAAQAQGLVGGGLAAITGNVGSIVMWGALAYGLFLFAPMLLKKRAA